jgi:gamma-glutamyl-gamma-aminobutyrate hydrolase PuuD
LAHDAPEGTPRGDPAHPVSIEPGGALAQALGVRETHVNSFHHQAAREPAPGVHIAARAPDGVVEAIEIHGHPFALGVQWHPEEMLAEPAMMRLFQAFVRASAQAAAR